jgi:hypothetical protein
MIITTIGVFTKDNITDDNYIEYNNSKFYFDNIFKESDLKKIYYNQIIQDIRLTPEHFSNMYRKENKTYILLGDVNCFIYLIDELFDEFQIQSNIFNVHVHQLNYDGIFNILTSKKVESYEDIKNDFKRNKIYFNTSSSQIDSNENSFKDCANTITKIYSGLIKNTKFSSYIFSIENKYNKITIYNLCDLRYFIEGYKSYSNDYKYIHSEMIKLDKLLTYNNSDTTSLNSISNYISKSFEIPNNKIKVIYNFDSSIKNLKLCNLFNSYKQKFTNNLVKDKYSTQKSINNINSPKKLNTDLIIIPKNPESPKKSNDIKYPEENKDDNYSDLIKKNQDILNKIDLIKKNINILDMVTKIKSMNKNIVDYKEYDDKEKDDIINNFLPKNTKKVKFDDEKNINSSLITFMPLKTTTNLRNQFEKLYLLNKFLFNNCVKNQIKLQKIDKNDNDLDIANEDFIIELKSLLSVALDYLKKI